MAKRKKVVRRKRPVQRAKPRQRPAPLRIIFTQAELAVLNRATGMLSLAQQSLEAVWKPIRTKYRLQQEITYDRKTGEVN